MEKLFNLNQVVEMTGLRPSQINYLVQDRRINTENVVRRGSGKKRLFKMEAVEEIKNYHENDQAES